MAPSDPEADRRRDLRIVGLIGTGHFLSHFYMLCLPPLFLVWRQEFGVSYATLGLAVALMSGDDGAAADPGRLPGGPARRAPLPGRRHAADGAVHRGHGLRAGLSG